MRKTTFLLEIKGRNKEGYEYKNAEILLFERRTLPFFKLFVRIKNTLTLVSDGHVHG